MRLACRLAACLSLWLPAAADDSTVAAADPAARWKGLHDELRALQQSHEVPALVLVVLDQGQPALVAASALEGSRPFHTTSPFRWGSITKSVTALTALEAARRHGLDPAVTPVARLLSPVPYRNPWAAAQPVTLAHLLELSAGLPDLTREEFNDNTPRPLEAALRRRAGRTLLWPPGLQHSYTNVAPGITAAVVEALTHEPFAAAARRLVFDPLGMEAAGFEPQAGLPGGFRDDGRTEIPYWHMTFTAFGALNASAADMARLLQALLNEGRVNDRQAVAVSSVRRMFRAQASLGAARGLEVAYGAGLYGWVSRGHVFHGHGGDADGYRSRLGLLPHAGRGYLIGINVDDPSLLRRMQRLTEQALTVDLPPPEPPPAATPTAAALARYTGVYYPSSTRFGLDRWRSGNAELARVVVENRALHFLRNGRSQQLVAVGDGRFRRPDDPAVSVVFARHDGTLYLQGELGNFARVVPGPCAGFLPTCGESAGTGADPDAANPR